LVDSSVNTSKMPQLVKVSRSTTREAKMKWMRNLIAAQALLILVPASAFTYITSATTTASLLEGCHRLASLECAPYILGVFDQMSYSRLICPDSTEPLGVQFVAIAVKYLNDHPEQWHIHPVVLIGQSFKAAFPCAKDLADPEHGNRRPQ
jgi:hypothetical protein